MTAINKDKDKSSDQLSVLKEVKLPEAIIQLKSDGIVYVKMYENMILDIPLQMRMFEIYKSITENVLTPFLFEGEDNITITKEARDNAISLEEESPCKAMAVIVTSIPVAMVANFYLKFNKPKRPYKVFKNRDEAIDWLKQYL
jgi:hypothetical protein